MLFSFNCPLGTYAREVIRWLLPIFDSHPKLSIDKPLPLRESLHSVHLRKNIQKCWTNELLASIDANRKPQFLYAAWRCYGPAYVIVSTCLLIVEFLSALQALLYYCYSCDPSPFYSLGLWALSLFYVILKHLWKASVIHMGIQLRISLQTLLLQKILLIDTSHIDYKDLNRKVMEVVRRLSKLDNLLLYTPYIFVVLIYMVALAGVLIHFYTISSSAILLTIVVLLSTIPCQVFLAYRCDAAGKMYIRQGKELESIMNEYRKSLEEVKTYKLDAMFVESINNHKQSKWKTVKSMGTYESVLFLISLNYTKVVTMVFLMAHTWFGELLPQEKVLLLLVFLEIFMYPLTISLSRSITLGAEFIKTINSLQDVLMMLDKACPTLDTPRKFSETVIEMNKVQAVSDPSLILKCKNLVLRRGESVAFPYEIPPQAKKTLLRLMTGELDLLDGSARIYGKVSFCSKQSWLFPRASIKRNILCHNFLNSQRYQTVIDICKLNVDFQFLPKSEETIIGCKGDINITKELAIKISIARALYANAEVYIFDQIFDLLPAQASTRLLQQILCWCSNKRKSVVLFSHRPWLVKLTGRWFNVSYNDILELRRHAVKTDFTIDLVDVDDEQPEEEVTEEYFTRDRYTSNFRDVRVAWKVKQASLFPKKIPLIEFRSSHSGKRKSTNSGNKMYTPLWNFVSSPSTYHGSALRTVVVFGIVLCSIFLHLVSSGWQYICIYQSVLPPMIDTDFLLILTVMCVAISFILFSQYYWVINNTLEAVHEGLMTTLFALKHWQNVERETIFFIMQNILPALDINLTATVIHTYKRWLAYISTLTVMVVYTPITLIQGALMTLGMIWIGKSCANYIAKLWHLQDELWGIVEVYYKFSDEQILSIRSLSACDKYKALYHEHMDNYSSVQYMAKSAVEGLSFWMGLISVINIGVLIFLGIMSDNDINNSIALFFSLSLPNIFPLLVEHSIRLLYYAERVQMCLNFMNKEQTSFVKRGNDYGETPSDSSDVIIHASSVVSKIGARLVYLDFSVSSGELIGVLGDGKKAVMSMLYGLSEILNGKVVINKKNDALTDGFISKNPHVFRGVLKKTLTLGKNLSEDELWAAINKAIVDIAYCIPGPQNGYEAPQRAGHHAHCLYAPSDFQQIVGLDYEMSQLTDGLATTYDNWHRKFTTYQRQLLYLAASIAAKTAVVVVLFDPTTCNGREEMEFIKKARKHLPGSTIFVLTSRLRSAVETEKIIVFRSGSAVEFGTTSDLISNSSSLLNSYINAIGKREVREELRNLAKVSKRKTN